MAEMNSKELYERLEEIRKRVSKDPEIIALKEKLVKRLSHLTHEQLHREMTI
jgi:hypothetical protein